MSTQDEIQATSAREIAREAAMRLRLAVKNKMGIELTPDVLRAFKLVLLETGGKPLGQRGQKAFQAWPFAYAAIVTKQSGQLSATERDEACTKTLVEFAIPQFIVLCKEAAGNLGLPLPSDLEKKMYLTTLGSGTPICTHYRRNISGSCVCRASSESCLYYGRGVGRTERKQSPLLARLPWLAGASG